MLSDPESITIYTLHGGSALKYTLPQKNACCNLSMLSIPWLANQVWHGRYRVPRHSLAGDEVA